MNAEAPRTLRENAEVGNLQNEANVEVGIWQNEAKLVHDSVIYVRPIEKSNPFSLAVHQKQRF